MIKPLEDKFLKFETKEIILKLKGFALSKELMKVWVGKDLSTYRVCDFKEDSVTLKCFSEDEDDLLFDGKEICFNFSFKNIDYFGKARFLKNKEKIELKLKEQIYRLEKRDNERVLTYPRYRVFLCMEGESESKSLENVVFLSKTTEKKVQKEVVREDQQKEKIHQVLSNEVKNPEDYISFRILDLSESGASVLMNPNDRDLFGKERDKAFIVFEKEIFEVTDLQVIYDVAYISQDAHLNMKKLGIQFDFNETLHEKTKKLLGENWENYLDAESIEKLLE